MPPDRKLPDHETLEQQGYEKDEIEKLVPVFESMATIPEDATRNALMRHAVEAIWPDPFVRMEKTCWILDNRLTSPTFGSMVRLVPNIAQRRFIDLIKDLRKQEQLVRIITLKARQLGFSTITQALFYTGCDVTPNTHSMTISYDDDSTRELFQKAIVIHRNHMAPQGTHRSKGTLIEFHNGSTFHTATAGKLSAGRSFTLHQLHCSETPMWPAAEEVLTGSLQAVSKHKRTIIHVESTAKGAVGSFHEMWKAAEEGRSEWVPFFAPWFWDPSYSTEFKSDDHKQRFARSLKPEDHAYQKKYRLTLEQMHWRKRKIEDDLEGNELKFRQEFPASPDEAFLSSGSPRFSSERVHALSHQVEQPTFIGNIFYVP